MRARERCFYRTLNRSPESKTHAHAGRHHRSGAGGLDAGAAAASCRHRFVIIENRSRDYIENRIRAGLIEHWAADLLIDAGVGERMQREGILHHGINIGINGDLHRIDFKALVGKRVTIYGQQEVVKDLVERAARRRRPAAVRGRRRQRARSDSAAAENSLHA